MVLCLFMLEAPPSARRDERWSVLRESLPMAAESIGGSVPARLPRAWIFVAPSAVASGAEVKMARWTRIGPPRALLVLTFATGGDRP